MNIKLIYMALGIMAILASCRKEQQYNLGVSDPDQYSSVYMPRASNEVINTPIAVGSTDVLKFQYNAYLGGINAASNNINVTFGVLPENVATYNTKNGTDCKLLPPNSYSMEKLTAIIPSGERSTGTLTINLKATEEIKPFESYVLPITITKADGVKINQTLATTYLLFTGSYGPGQVPRKKVLSLGQNWGNLLAPSSKGCLMIRNNVNDIVLYAPDQEGNFTVNPRVILQGWGGTESFYYLNENSIIVRNYPYYAGVFSFNLDANQVLIGANPFWLGDFWDKYVLVPFKAYFLTIDNTGTMWRQPTLTDINTPKTQVGTGFKDYKQIIAYQNGLIATTANGDLWYFPMTNDGVPGTKRQIGSGWDMYKQIIVSGTDLLALDGANDIYRYKFDPRGFWPLK